MKQNPNQQGRLWLLLLVLALPVCILLSLRFGSQNFTTGQLIQALWERDASGVVWRILVYVRAPRTLAGVLAGAALSVAGVLLQSVLNNAMASPNVIGVNAGAGFFALLAGALLHGTPQAVPVAAFLGALGTAMLVYLLALRAGLSRTTLILAGLAVSGMLTAGVNTIKLLYPDATSGADGFLLGGLSGVTLSALGNAAPYILLGMLLALMLAADLNVLALGEESAMSLGLAIGRVRFLAILAAALLAGAAVSFAGLLSFVGLLVPHMARRLVGQDARCLIPAAGLMGACLLLLCDVLARVLFAPFELPVGILLSLIGGPFFLSLLLRRKRGRVYD